VIRYRAATIVLLILGVATAGAVTYRREQILAAPREVGVVLDHAAALIVAGELGIEPQTFLEDLLAERATALGVSEVSLADLPYRPQVTVYHGHELLRPAARPGDHPGMARRVLQGHGWFEPWYTYIIAGDPAFAAFLVEGATLRLGADRVRSLELWGGAHAVILRGVPTRPRPDPRRPDRDIREPDLRFGFWSGDFALARELGLTPVALLTEDPRLAPGDLEYLLGPVVRREADVIFLAGDTAWGYGDQERLAAAARFSRQWGLHLASLAPGEQPGFADLAATVDYQGLRFQKHRAGDPLEEAATAMARNRPRGLHFVPALFPGPAEATREGNRQALRELVAAMARYGYRPGPPRALAPYRLPPGPAAILGGAVAAGVLGATGAAAGWLGRKRPGLPSLLVGAAVAAALGYGWPGAGREALAFLAAVSFPVWIVLAVLAAARRGGEVRARLRRAVLLAVAATAGTVAAGLLVRALLADTAYALEIRSFPAVWAAAAVPLLAIFALTGPARAESIARRELSWGDLLLGAGALAVGVLLAASQAVPISPLQFLAGHPALVVGLAVPGSAKGWQAAISLLVAAGQVSVMNSFTNFWVPMSEVLQRTGGGLILGVALGLAGALAWRRYDRERGDVS